SEDLVNLSLNGGEEEDFSFDFDDGEEEVCGGARMVPRWEISL
ncbi:hypothetical protein L195_g006102, partial [Trifolium pratense]